MSVILDSCLDELDVKILREIERDGRISYAELGQKIGLSKTPCWNRVLKLKERGVIKGFHSDFDAHSLGLSIRALVHIVVDFEQYKAFEAAILAHNHVIACHAVTGEFDYLVEIIAQNMNEFDRLLRDDLSQIAGVKRFNTSLSTRVIKQRGRLSELIGR